MKQIKGKITGVEDAGTIIMVRVEGACEDAVVEFDHRMFRHMVNAEGALVGRECTVYGEGGEQRLELE